jgi:hypothetical protein
VDAAEAVRARLEQAEELLQTTREELVEARAQLEAATERAQQQEARAVAAEGRAAEEAEERKTRPRRNAEVRRAPSAVCSVQRRHAVHAHHTSSPLSADADDVSHPQWQVEARVQAAVEAQQGEAKQQMERLTADAAAAAAVLSERLHRAEVRRRRRPELRLRARCVAAVAWVCGEEHHAGASSPHALAAA